MHISACLVAMWGQLLLVKHFFKMWAMWWPLKDMYPMWLKVQYWHCHLRSLSSDNLSTFYVNSAEHSLIERHIRFIVSTFLPSWKFLLKYKDTSHIPATALKPPFRSKFLYQHSSVYFLFVFILGLQGNHRVEKPCILQDHRQESQLKLNIICFLERK